ncbi:hypothetical protein CPB83DRAFT_904850 [Crepidotus variabilis]|uniref:Uncharacterized protein n=1 Tax=Crepidotus variabilis TaxID=179855 RepID=A0A9P6EKK3_9AGAR|nr:hypothetical protein CPB83DRAFT_904850 [Crepidotus variabilis]
MLSKLIAFTSLVALAQALTVDVTSELTKRDAKCYAGPGGYGHSNDLDACIQNMVNNPNWGQWDCGGRSFFLGGSAWNSPGDCIGGCKPCLNGSAGLGLEWAKCDQQTGVSAHCWVGYCPPGQSPCGNSDGSCC